MPTIVIPTVAVAAGASTNILAGHANEYMSEPCEIELAVVAEAVGVLVSVQSGRDVLQEEGPAIIVAANGMPRYPDDFYLDDVADAGDKLTIRARNTTAGAINVRAVVKVTPLG